MTSRPKRGIITIIVSTFHQHDLHNNCNHWTLENHSPRRRQKNAAFQLDLLPFQLERVPQRGEPTHACCASAAPPPSSCRPAASVATVAATGRRLKQASSRHPPRRPRRSGNVRRGYRNPWTCAQWVHEDSEMCAKDTGDDDDDNDD
jgi:hypothetical protein